MGHLTACLVGFEYFLVCFCHIKVIYNACKTPKSEPDGDNTSSVLTKWITFVGSLLTGTGLQQVLLKQKNNSDSGVSATDGVDSNCCSSWCKILLLLLLKPIFGIPILYGPAGFYNTIKNDHSEIAKNNYGYGFLFVLLAFTLVAIAYIIVSEVASCYHVFKRNELMKKFKEAGFKEAYENIPVSFPSFFASILVLLSNFTLLIPVIIMVALIDSRPDRRITGWYAKADCSTMQMYVAFYALAFRMGHISLIYTFSLDKWVQGRQ
jgi:hypothetical protein